MKRFKLGLCTLIIASALPWQAYGEVDDLSWRLDTLEDRFKTTSERMRINGFFSFSGTRMSESDAVYNRTTSSNTNLEDLSKFGLQMEFRITENTRFTTQLLSRGWDGWKTNAEWAFLSHDLNRDTTIRAGRLRIPVYMNSEFIDAGFTYPWVSPPIELYTLLPFSSYEGIDLRYNFEAFKGFWTFQPYYGSVRLTEREERIQGAQGDDLHGFDLKANWGNFTARVGYFGVKVDVDDFALADVALGINQSIREGIANDAADGATQGALMEAGCGPGGTTDFFTCQNIAAETRNAVFENTLSGLENSLPDPDLSWQNSTNRFYTVGFSYDDGRWLLLTEYGKAELADWNPDTTSCYGTIGYRFGRFMPHLTYSHIRVDDPESREYNDLQWTTPPPASQSIPNPAGSFIQRVYQLDQESWIAGLRYDHGNGIALKAEVQRVGGFEGEGSGFFIPDDQGQSLPDDFWVYRMSLDIVF